MEPLYFNIGVPDEVPTHNIGVVVSGKLTPKLESIYKSTTIEDKLGLFGK